MSEVKIILDTRGGDKGAPELIKGAALALEKYPELKLVLAGERAVLESAAEENGMPQERYEILEADSEITNYDDPAQALFHKTGASMLVSLDSLAKRGDIFGMVTCGNTAVLLTGVIKYLPGEARVRPALAAVLPAQNGGFTCLVDTGATTDCNPPVLHHFARLGSALMRDMYGIASPRVGLLSNGTEPTKGNKLVKETHPLLAADETVNFIGNVEGNEALSGCCDVLVCDGFAGNQVLKVTEGTAKRIITDIMIYAHRTKSRDIAALGEHLMSIYDIGSLGGGIVLGAPKPVIKARGSADAKAVVSVCGMLLNMAANKAVFDAEKNRI
ncbi:MAG: phosphate acyltransferase [Clostridia bacterium]|nr:phosphate acyltransferase [Clostridia bacterium]